MNEERDSVNSEIETAETTLSVRKKQEAVLQRKRDELRSESKEAAGRARGWTSKLRTLRLHVIEDEEEEAEEEQSQVDDQQESQLNIQEQSRMKVDMPEESNAGQSATRNRQSESTCLEVVTKLKGTKLIIYTEEQLAGLSYNF